MASSLLVGFRVSGLFHPFQAVVTQVAFARDWNFSLNISNDLFSNEKKETREKIDSH